MSKRNRSLVGCLYEVQVILEQLFSQVKAARCESDINIKQSLLKESVQLEKQLPQQLHDLVCLEPNNHAGVSFKCWLRMKFPDLPPKYQEVCELLHEGLQTKEIAVRLNLSYETVRGYRKEIRKIMNVEDDKLQVALERYFKEYCLDQIGNL